MFKKILSLGVVLVVGLCVLCGCREKYVNEGSFYSFEEAYENGWLTQEDIKDIAYYFHAYFYDEYDENYVARPKVPETLDAEMEKKIKITYLFDIIKDPTLSLNYIEMGYYYGTYGECIAVGIDDSYLGKDIVYYPEYEIAGVTFYNFSPANIRIWKAD